VSARRFRTLSDRHCPHSVVTDNYEMKTLIDDLKREELTLRQMP
jgi:hypothetical protein